MSNALLNVVRKKSVLITLETLGIYTFNQFARDPDESGSQGHTFKKYLTAPTPYKCYWFNLLQELLFTNVQLDAVKVLAIDLTFKMLLFIELVVC